MKRAFQALLIASLSALALPQASAAVIDNGSFESVALGDGDSLRTTSLSGWNVDGFVRLIDPAGNNALIDGDNVLRLRAGNGISQSLSLNDAVRYTLSFAYRLSSSGDASFSVGGNTVDLAAGTRTYSYSFTGSSASSLLSFNADAGRLTLDNVSIAAAVPEPETYALMLAGLVMVGLYARRRHRREHDAS